MRKFNLSPEPIIGVEIELQLVNKIRFYIGDNYTIQAKTYMRNKDIEMRNIK